MTIEPMGASDLAELEEFFQTLGMKVAPENLRHFSQPREAPPRLRVVTLVMRDAGRMIGTIGYIEVPLRIARGADGARAEVIDELSRWPINWYLSGDYRGRGLGRRLIEAVNEGVSCRVVIGGTAASIPVFDRTGYRMVGHLTRHQWLAPPLRLLDPAKLRDRWRRGSRRRPPEVLEIGARGGRIVARRVDRVTGWVPWAAADAAGIACEIGVPRDAGYLEFAFCGALRRHHTLHTVHVGGALSGFFVLAARSERALILTAEIVDIDAIPGRELQVLRAALGAAFRCADVVRLRMRSARFDRFLGALSPRARGSADNQLRISCDPGSALHDATASDAGRWRVTYGDHDQYRVRSSSQIWGEG